MPFPTEPVEVEEEEFALVITEPFKLIDLDGVTAASPKRYIAAARLGEFPILRAGTSRTVQKRAPFKTGKRAGDPQSDVDVKHLWLFAGMVGAMGFLAHFKDNRFESATVWNVGGWPTEPWTDYNPNAAQLKRQKDEPEKAYVSRVGDLRMRAWEMDQAYNESFTWMNKSPRPLESAAEFEEWLGFMVKGFVPREKAEPKKKQAEATAVDLIEIGEWNG